MNINPAQSYITCEFESIDQADLGIGRLIKETGGIRGVTMRRRQQNRPHSAPILPAVDPVTDSSPAYLMAANPHSLFSILQESGEQVEPEQIRSVAAEVRCNRKNARDVASRLTSLGATHIHIH